MKSLTSTTSRVLIYGSFRHKSRIAHFIAYAHRSLSRYKELDLLKSSSTVQEARDDRPSRPRRCLLLQRVAATWLILLAFTMFVFALADRCLNAGNLHLNHREYDSKKRSQKSENGPIFYRRFGPLCIYVQRDPADPLWTMYLESVRGLEPEFDPKYWGTTAGLPSQKFVLSKLDVCLRDFRSKYPAIKIDSLIIDPHVIRELWTNILVGLKTRLETMPGVKKADDVYISGTDTDPDFISNAIRHVILISRTHKSIILLFQQHNINFERCMDSNDTVPFFSTACDGHKWSQIAKWPGLGMGYPMLVVFQTKEAERE